MPGKSREWIGRALFEGALIVVAVVLGFWVTEWQEQRRAEAAGQLALERIVAEIESNRGKIARVLPYHEDIAAQLRALRREPPATPVVDTLFAIADQGIGDVLLYDEAWTTALAQDALVPVAFEQVQMIAGVYNAAESGVSSSWRYLILQLGEKPSFMPDTDGSALKRLSFAYDNLASQERSLLRRYDQVLNALKDRS